MIYILERQPPLPEPKTPFQELVRRLAEVAMQVTHHDASETEAGYIHEVRLMERRFRVLLRSYHSKGGKAAKRGRI